MKLKSTFIILLLAIMTGGIFSQFYNTESFLNGLDTTTTHDRDYDRDGDKESSDSHDIEFLKISYLVIPPTFFLQLASHDLSPIRTIPQGIIPHHLGRDFTLSIFRPPIFA